MGQRSRATIDPKWAKYCLQDRQFRTSCRSRLICQFWKQFVFCNATTGIVGTRCTTTLWKQGCIKFVFGFSDELATRKLWQKPLSDDKQDAKDPLADMPFWLEDFTDNLKVPEMRAPAHSSRDSESRTSYESGNKIMEAQCFFSHPENRNCDVCMRTKMTSASCRTRTGEALPRAEKFGDLMTSEVNP